MVVSETEIQESSRFVMLIPMEGVSLSGSCEYLK